MSESLRKTGALFALVIIMAFAVYLLINFNTPPTGQITLPTSGFFAGESQNPDVNEDGVVDIFDAIVVLKNVDQDPFDPKADVNLDGKVDNADVDIILNLINAS